MSDTNGWSAGDLRDLALAQPEMVGKLPDGTLVPTLSRDEWDALVARYGSSMLRGPSQAAFTEAATADPKADAELARWYPTMARRR